MNDRVKSTDTLGLVLRTACAVLAVAALPVPLAPASGQAPPPQGSPPSTLRLPVNIWQFGAPSHGQFVEALLYDDKSQIIQSAREDFKDGATPAECALATARCCKKIDWPALVDGSQVAVEQQKYRHFRWSPHVLRLVRTIQPPPPGQ